MKDRSWIHFVALRISKVDRKGRTAANSFLASLGIGIGVMALIVIMSVMNGFQLSFINSILEINSYHVRGTNVGSGPLTDFRDKRIRSVTPFYEFHSLIFTEKGSQKSAVVHAVPKDIMERDRDFAREMRIVSGSFDLDGDDSVVLGSGLAKQLNVRRGSTVTVCVLSGSSSRGVFSASRKLTVKGVFFCGDRDINSSFAFMSSQEDGGGAGFFSKAGVPLVHGIKLASSGDDQIAMALLRKKFPSAEFVSWREFNRGFFGVLRVEKNMLFLLVLLIFVVVAINIFNGMKRLVFERKSELAVLSVLGGKRSDLVRIFIFQGLVTSMKGAVPGLLAGLLVTRNMQLVFELLFMVFRNPMFSAYARIKPQVIPGEVALIFAFGVVSSVVSAFAAGSEILHISPSEVLRDE